MTARRESSFSLWGLEREEESLYGGITCITRLREKERDEKEREKERR